MNHEKMLRIMKSKGMSNNELAEKSGIPLGTLNKILYGVTKDPSVNTVRAIAHALGYIVDDFVEEDYQERNYYLNPEAAEIAQEVYERPEMRMLFDASRKVSAEDLKAVIAIVDRMKKDQNHEE